MDRDDVASALKNVKLEGFVWPEPDDADDVRLIKNVIAHGRHIIGVEKEIGYPEFAYSIGLYQAMWPDKTGRFPSDPACEPRVTKAQMLRRK